MEAIYPVLTLPIDCQREIFSHVTDIKDVTRLFLVGKTFSRTVKLWIRRLYGSWVPHEQHFIDAAKYIDLPNLEEVIGVNLCTDDILLLIAYSRLQHLRVVETFWYFGANNPEPPSAVIGWFFHHYYIVHKGQLFGPTTRFRLACPFLNKDQFNKGTTPYCSFVESIGPVIKFGESSKPNMGGPRDTIFHRHFVNGFLANLHGVPFQGLILTDIDCQPSERLASLIVSCGFTMVGVFGRDAWHFLTFLEKCPSSLEIVWAVYQYSPHPASSINRLTGSWQPLRHLLATIEYDDIKGVLAKVPGIDTLTISIPNGSSGLTQEELDLAQQFHTKIESIEFRRCQARDPVPPVIQTFSKGALCFYKDTVMMVLEDFNCYLEYLETSPVNHLLGESREGPNSTR